MIDWHLLMQVWKHLQKQLPGNRGDRQEHKESPPSPSASSISSVRLSGCTEQRTSASTFYIEFSDDDTDKSQMNITSTKSSKHSHVTDSNSAQGQSLIPANSRTDRERNPATADGKLTVPPRPSKPKKPKKQQQQLADGAAINSRPQNPPLIMHSRDTLYPSASEPARETLSSAPKPVPPVCY